MRMHFPHHASGEQFGENSFVDSHAESDVHADLFQGSNFFICGNAARGGYRQSGGGAQVFKPRQISSLKLALGINVSAEEF